MPKATAVRSKKPPARPERSFSRNLARVAGGARVAIKDKRGHVVAALVPADDLTRLELLEDFLDAVMAYEALAEGPTIPWEKVRKELGLGD